MPVKSEQVSNRPLAASDLSTILRRDFDTLLRNDGLLSSSQIAFGRVSYDLRVTLHLDNPSYPEHRANQHSRPATELEIIADPPLAALSPPPPLSSPSPEAIPHIIERHRDLPSPNLARIQHGLPVTIERRGQDGHLIEQQVVYPESIAEGEGPEPVDTDLSGEAGKDWGKQP